VSTRPPASPASSASDGYLFDVDAGGPTRPSTSAATQFDLARSARDDTDDDVTGGADDDADDADTESSLDAPTVPVDLRALGLAQHAAARPAAEPSPVPDDDPDDDPDTDPFDAPTIAGGLFVPGPPGQDRAPSPTSFPPLPRSAK
jgi:hypothetical protein